MARQTVETRLERLEQRVTAIEHLPARIDRLELQFVQLRTELRDEFSAIRHEAQSRDAEVVRGLRDEIRAGDEETRRVLRDEIRTGNVMIVTALTEQTEELRRHMLLLFEEAVSRIANVQEQRPAPRKKKR